MIGLDLLIVNLWFGLLLIEIIFLPLFLLWWVKSELNRPLKPVWAEVQLIDLEAHE